MESFTCDFPKCNMHPDYECYFSMFKNDSHWEFRCKQHFSKQWGLGQIDGYCEAETESEYYKRVKEEERLGIR